VKANTRLSLVTGGAGFIGSHIVRLLAARGERVRVLDLERPAQRFDGVEALCGSICDRATVRTACDGVDRVFHLAANPNLWAADKSSFARVNLDGTRTVLEEAHAARAERIVYCSTESILLGKDERTDAAFDGELSHLAPGDMPGPYTRSKLLADREAFAAAKAGVPVVIVNPTLPLGPGDRKLTPPTRMLLRFLNCRSPLYLDFAMNMVDVRHAAFGHILAADRGKPGERYILAGANVTLGELLAMLNDITGCTMPRWKLPHGVVLAISHACEFVADHVTHRPPMAPLEGARLARAPMVFHATKARDALGMPETNLRRALADAVCWMQQRGLVRRPMPKLAAAQLQPTP
jgi:dihydroflavonol-4-reductase